ncbi:MAG: PQQ-binding-like beta-propeller repeat protein [Bacteroidales bacterium]|nr:PQQ-binding-like beta-propeller repeat protein [Bacteroidales bacterium]
MFSRLIIAVVIFGLLISGHRVQAQNASWLNYRGPQSNGHSNARDIPVTWSDSTHVTWKTAIKGRGWSTPVILNNQIWLTTAAVDGTEFRVICINEKSGSVIYNIKLFGVSEPQEKHPLNSYASPSPVLEHGRVYVHFGTFGTACINTGNGAVIWKRNDIHCEHEVGPGSSPFLYKNLLILTMDGTDVQYLEALDSHTGKTVWKRPRGLDFSHLSFDRKKAFYTPVLSKVDGRELLFCAGPHAVMAYVPETGKEVWRVRYEGFSGSSQPVIGGGMIFINTGFGKSSMLGVRLGGKGDQTDNAIIWMNVRNMQARSSPLLINGLLFMINTGGQAKCLDPKTGKEIWSARVGRQTSASPIYVEGKIYSFDQDGMCTIFKPGRVFTKVAENHLPDGCMASPVVVDGAIIVRTMTHLYKFRN